MVATKLHSADLLLVVAKQHLNLGALVVRLGPKIAHDESSGPEDAFGERI